MHDPRVVANYMLDFAETRHLPVTNLSLQKLLFFAHAISLAEARRGLVSGFFEAWQFGPVHPLVYQCFRDCGAERIPYRATAFNPVSRATSELPALTDVVAQSICERVVTHLGVLTPGRLVELTHAKGGPWDYVVSSAKERASLGLRIPDSVIVARYSRLKVSVSETPPMGEPHEDSPFIRDRPR